MGSTNGSTSLAEERLTEAIIGAAIEVHRRLGPGLLERVYQECLAAELERDGCRVEKEVPIPLTYRGHDLGIGYRIDLLVDDAVVVEVKAQETILPVHAAQLLSYLRLADKRVGLLLNFHEPTLIDGLTRVVN